MDELLRYLNNYFVHTVEITTLTFDDHEITGFSEDYLAGQYIQVEGTILNDGVYKIVSNLAGVITVAEDLTAETRQAYLWGLALPKELITLQAEIEAYKTTSTDGLASESQGSRSVSYKDGSSWTQVFKSRLIPYRRLYSDKEVVRLRCKDVLY